MNEPACRFCLREMTWVSTHIPTSISTGPNKDDIVETYKCRHCKSTQDFIVIEPTCLFCKGKLGLGQPMYDTKDYKTVSQTSRCHKCNVNQTFSPEGKPLSYTFIIKPYVLVFDLQANQFTIREQANYSVPLLTCNYIPKNLTPQSVTLERLKTLILFS